VARRASRRCRAFRVDGTPCRAWATADTEVCRVHCMDADEAFRAILPLQMAHRRAQVQRMLPRLVAQELEQQAAVAAWRRTARGAQTTARIADIEPEVPDKSAVRRTAPW
jgi:hypothetical protein